jgi:hypothetical protein
MMLRKGLATASVMFLLSSVAWAQTSTSGGTSASSTSGGTTSATTGGTTSTIGSFAALAPGNQTIVRALFEAQQPPTPTGAASTTSTTSTTSTGATSSASGTPLTLDQIAALKGHEGWGVVFKQMKAEGLVQAKNLGQVVSRYRQELRASAAAAASSNTVVTSASGRTLASSGTGHSGTTAGSGASHGKSSGARDDMEASSGPVTTASSSPASFVALGNTHGGGSATAGGEGGAGSHGGGSVHGR